MQALQHTIELQKSTLSEDEERASQEIVAMASLITSFQTSTLELLQSKAMQVEAQHAGQMHMPNDDDVQMS